MSQPKENQPRKNPLSLQDLQAQAREAIFKYLDNSQINAIDENGVKQNCPIKHGEARPANIIGFAGKGADDVAKKLEPLYQHFREKHFETLIKKGQDKEANEYFFGVLLPRQYNANSDPLTMTEQQFAKAQQFLSKDDKSTNIHSESLGENPKTLAKSHAEKKADWLEKILHRGPQGQSKTFAERLEKQNSPLMRG